MKGCLKMKKVEVYEAFDGMRFDTEKECQEHEKNSLVGAISAAQTLANFCISISQDCNTCFFGCENPESTLNKRCVLESYMVEDWELYNNIGKPDPVKTACDFLKGDNSEDV